MTRPDDKISKASDLLTEAQADLQQVLAATATADRGHLNDMLWQTRRMTGSCARYFSQSGQDWFVDQVLLKEETEGVFVDIGGFDGVTGSNSLFFEVFRNWSGLLIEPVAAHCNAAKSFRRCPCLQATVSGVAGVKPFLEVRSGYTQMSGLLETYDPETLRAVRAHPDHSEETLSVQALRLEDMLQDAGISKIDYLSIDVEGGELDILADFDLQAYGVRVLSVENPGHLPAIRDEMQARDYRLVEFLGVDEIYCSAPVLARARTT